MIHKSHDACSSEIYIINIETYTISIETYTISDLKLAASPLQKVTQPHDASSISTDIQTQSCDGGNVETDCCVMSEMVKQTLV